MVLISKEALLHQILDGPFWAKTNLFRDGKQQANDVDVMARKRVIQLVENAEEVHHITCADCAYRRDLGEYSLCLKIGGPLYGKELKEDVSRWYCADAQRGETDWEL